jgi:hypothetical protein
MQAAQARNASDPGASPVCGFHTEQLGIQNCNPDHFAGLGKQID